MKICKWCGIEIESEQPSQNCCQSEKCIKARQKAYRKTRADTYKKTKSKKSKKRMTEDEVSHWS